MRGWTIQDAIELYDVHAWGAGFVSVNEQGHVEIRPRGNGGPGIDLYELVDLPARRGLHVPLLIRFSDILAARIRSLCECFGSAIAEHQFKGRYRGGLPDQGQPAAPRRRGGGRLRARLRRRPRGRQQARAAGDPADHGQPGVADHLQRLQGPRVHRDRAARAEARPHADHRRRPLPRARPGDPGVARPRHPAAHRRARQARRARAPGAGTSRAATAASSA